MQANLTIGDSLKLLKNSEEIFDVVYIDPPYKSEVYDDILSVVKGNIIIVEHASEINFDNFQMLKQKKYGGSMITYLSKTQSGTIM